MTCPPTRILDWNRWLECDNDCIVLFCLSSHFFFISHVPLYYVDREREKERVPRRSTYCVCNKLRCFVEPTFSSSSNGTGEWKKKLNYAREKLVPVYRMRAYDTVIIAAFYTEVICAWMWANEMASAQKRTIYPNEDEYFCLRCCCCCCFHCWFCLVFAVFPFWMEQNWSKVLGRFWCV